MQHVFVNHLAAVYVVPDVSVPELQTFEEMTNELEESKRKMCIWLAMRSQNVL